MKGYFMRKENGVMQLLHEAMAVRGYALKTQQFYMQTIKEYVTFHGNRDPRYMGMVEVELFMEHLSRTKGVFMKRKQEIFQALMFFYTQVLKRSLQKEYLDASRRVESAKSVVGKKGRQMVMAF
jgi:hypothetical protein